MGFESPKFEVEDAVAKKFIISTKEIEDLLEEVQRARSENIDLSSIANFNNKLEKL
jgi:uncharacterized tellurite resistance protein B-like protein